MIMCHGRYHGILVQSYMVCQMLSQNFMPCLWTRDFRHCKSQNVKFYDGQEVFSYLSCFFVWICYFYTGFGRSVSIPRPKEETLLRHSILGPNGLSGRWQPPISNEGVCLQHLFCLLMQKWFLILVK